MSNNTYKIKFPSKKNIFQIIEYFKNYNIFNFFEKPITQKNRPIKKLINPWGNQAYKPELFDLYFLHEFIIINKRLTVLEFGSGWSSLVMANALMINRNKFMSKIKNLRKKNKFELHILENEKKYLSITKLRNNKYLPKFKKNIFYNFSECRMTTFNDRFCTEYDKLPLVNPDFIYLDGPDQFKIKNKLNNFTTNHTDMMPMVSDILKFENFLIPGTVIVVDGRTANSFFLKNNFQRNWIYNYDKNNDRNFFYLKDDSLGVHNDELLKFYKSK